MELTHEYVEIVRRQRSKKDLELFRLSKAQLEELNKVIEEVKNLGVPKKFVKRKLKGKIGYGIFLHVNANPIMKGQVVGPYDGEVFLVAQNNVSDGSYSFDLATDLRLTKSEQERFDPRNQYHPNRFYSLKLDAFRMGNFTRFINHSSNHPNVEARLAFANSKYQIIYMAKKTILPSEQLLISYEDGEEGCYWDPLGIKPYPMTPKTFRIDSSLKIIQ